MEQEIENHYGFFYKMKMVGAASVVGVIAVLVHMRLSSQVHENQVYEKDLDGNGVIEQILTFDGKEYVLHKEVNGNVVGVPFTTGTYSSSNAVNTIDDKVQK